MRKDQSNQYKHTCYGDDVIVKRGRDQAHPEQDVLEIEGRRAGSRSLASKLFPTSFEIPTSGERIDGRGTFLRHGEKSSMPHLLQRHSLTRFVPSATADRFLFTLTSSPTCESFPLNPTTYTYEDGDNNMTMAKEQSSGQPMRGGKAITQNSTAFLLPRLHSLQQETPHLNVLDVATGHGSSTMMLAHAMPGSTITAIDIDPDVFDRARAFCNASGVQGVNFHEADARNLPFPDATFDVVFCHQFLVHVPRPWEILREMARVTKPGGIIAAREGDYETEAVWSMPEGIRKMHQLVAGSITEKGGDPAGGRKLLEWTLRAGFKRSQVTLSYSHWLFQSTEERKAWVEQVTSILRDNTNWLPKMGIDKGLATAEDLEEIAQGWEEWGGNEGAHQVMLSAEVIIEN